MLLAQLSRKASAALCSWLGALSLPLSAAYAASQLLFSPFDLTLVELRLYPGTFLRALFWPIGIAFSSAWLLRELRRQPVLEARTQLGRKNHSLQVPVLLGIMGSVAICIFLYLATNGDSAKRAKAAVAQKLGPNYKYCASRINIAQGPFGKIVSVSVMAYNHREIRSVPVRWSEDLLGRMLELHVDLPNPELPLTGPEVWSIQGTTYKVESTALFTCDNGEQLLTITAHVDFSPNSTHKPVAWLLAQYAVEHGYLDRALKAWTNPPPQDQLRVGVSLLDPGSTPERVFGCRYNFPLAELGAHVANTAINR